ncbi:hypothetical protein MJO28_010871 [Puccinia striiformis f. sp. tritici]|uniref:Uncharacterized protein n=4 Tax=Puccinia striiformis TaxID=27350 RepID=A0A0L0UXT2_9BASI|nr:hypothetical protein Pst134EB_020600 [Puccinia striiformis f. sp. tritici]KAI9618682.1 hypothetical protein KEM48_006567 [Puccinia striiformis f. sp. tritici PST-130]KNE91857.1 hypothetical protein PSTG_14761 [Puccinia striiformis f. sp. tritici PST-78]POW00313.1 hypothetical protein PSTT_13207 [Puccinia striiformis]KAI7945176.1 hypothetical protein MJO28_010871 [Puccinia striiformis f. sp. tritici]
MPLGYDLFQRADHGDIMDRDNPSVDHSAPPDNGGNPDNGHQTTITCSATFNLFYSRTNNANETVWKPMKSPKVFKFNLTAESTNYEQFINTLTAESDKSYRSAGPLIKNAIISKYPPLALTVYLTRAPSLYQFEKKDNYHIRDLASFNYWINAVAAIKKDTVNAVFKLVMESPGALEKQKATSTAAANYVLSQEAARVASTSRLNTLSGGESSQVDVAVSSNAFDETINLHKKELYARHAPNKKYEKDIPVFLHPSDNDRYIPLTKAAMEKWALALDTGVDGVSVDSPPGSLVYVKLSAKKRKANEAFPTGTSELGQLLRVLTNNNKDSNSSIELDVASSSSDSEPIAATMEEYLTYLEFDTSEQTAIMKILKDNAVKRYQLFDPKFITEDKMLKWGLQDGHIAELKGNISKFQKYLKKRSTS